jgi:hypothetical protein
VLAKEEETLEFSLSGLTLRKGYLTTQQEGDCLQARKMTLNNN